MRMLRLLSLFVIAGAAIMTSPKSTLADCGSIPFYAPVLEPVNVVVSSAKEAKDLKVDPLKISVFEPKQRAIILWNGFEEILLLSTDQRATQKSAVLEVIPLPAEPRVRLGSFKTFEVAQKLVVEKRLWACAHGGAAAGIAAVPESAGRITFHEQLGAHNLAVATVVNPDGFMEFVQSYLRDNYKAVEAPIRPDFVKVIQSYLDRGFRWFAFDVIVLDGSVKSREPIEYRFRSDKVFYPLRISSLEVGKTEVELLVFSAGGLTQFEDMPAEDIEAEDSLSVTPAEIAGLEESWKDFLTPKSGVVLDQWKVSGESSRLLRDIAVK